MQRVSSLALNDYARTARQRNHHRGFLGLHQLARHHESRFGQAQNGNAFNSCLSAIKLARDLGRSSVVHSVLDMLEKQINKMSGFFASDIQSLSTVLTHLDGVNPIQIARSTEALRKVRKL